MRLAAASYKVRRDPAATPSARTAYDERPAVETPNTMAAKARSAPGRILVIEDDWDILEVMKLMLEDEGHHIVTAKHGRAGLATINGASKPFDVVVMDISMPEMSGIEVAQALRANPKTADMRIAIHTALDERSVRERFADYDLFLTKAHDADVLPAKIAALLATQKRVPGGALPATPAFSADEALRARQALRTSIGLGPLAYPLPAFLELMAEEIAQLRSTGQSDAQIADSIGEAIGRPVPVEAVAACTGRIEG